MVRYIYFFLKANKKIKDTLICNINMKIIFLLINFQNIVKNIVTKYYIKKIKRKKNIFA